MKNFLACFIILNLTSIGYAQIIPGPIPKCWKCHDSQPAGEYAATALKIGSAPTLDKSLIGEGYTNVKNWDFGVDDGQITNLDKLSAEFQYHDQFNTIANGCRYGAVIAAPNTSTALSDDVMKQWSDPKCLGLKSQPISKDVREFKGSSIILKVLPLKSSQTTIGPATKHDAITGSFVSKFSFPKAGKLYGKDILWETKVRAPNLTTDYWQALWTAGNKWDDGAEMDVLEAFSGVKGSGLENGRAWHTNAVPPTNDKVNYQNWWRGLDVVPDDQQDLRQYHIFTWLYRKDDTYSVWFDGYNIQNGQLHWTEKAKEGVGENPIDMRFLFDITAGIIDVYPMNILTLPTNQPLPNMEIDWSRVWVK